MEDCIALILGGGAGTRLFPLTQRRAKPAVPFAGKYRLIDVPVSNCINSDIYKIFVLTQFNSASLNRHVANSYTMDHFRQGFVSVVAAEQTRASLAWFQGTADAVRQGMPHFLVYRHDDVLILSGDQLYTMDYGKLITHHRKCGADITVATVPVTAADAPGFGILKTNDQHVITEFSEKPQDLTGKQSPVAASMHQQGRVYLASMGIYVFSSGVLRSCLDDLPEDHDFGKQIIPRAINNRLVVSYPFDGFWSDIGTIKSFYDANLLLAKPTPKYSIYETDMPLYTNARMLPPAKVNAATVRDSLVSEGSIMEKCTITESVIGIRSYISKGAVVERSIIMGTDYFPWLPQARRDSMEGPAQPTIGEGCVISGAIVDKNVGIGAGSIIRNDRGVQEFDGDQYYIRDGIVVIPKNADISSGTII